MVNKSTLYAFVKDPNYFTFRIFIIDVIAGTAFLSFLPIS